MSLDVYLNSHEKVIQECICSCCNNIHYNEHYPMLFHANITHNLGRMASSCQVYECLWRPEEIGIVHAHQLIEPLTKSLELLTSNPSKYTEYEPSNGWGKVSTLISFIDAYLEACKEFPNALIEISR